MANSSNSDIPVPFNLKRSSEKGGVVSIKLKVVDNEILPATAPLGHPHVLNTPSKIDEHGTWPAIRLADGVATVLSNYSHSAFKEFFDPSVKSCLLIQCTKHPKWSCSKRFLIYREGKTVIAGAYDTYGRNGSCADWGGYIKAIITDTGAWNEVYSNPKNGFSFIENGTPEWSTYREYTPTEMAWMSVYQPYPYPEMNGSGTKEGELWAQIMLQSRIWKETKVLKKVTWIAN